MADKITGYNGFNADMNQDPMSELYEICECALCAARERALTEDEISALRFAAGVPEGRAAAHDCGRQQEIFEWH